MRIDLTLGPSLPVRQLETGPKRRTTKLPGMVAYRLRIELPDRPGALAGVTTEIAESEANILSIDVHEVDGNTAIDEIVVEVADDWAPGALAGSMALSGVGNLL